MAQAGSAQREPSMEEILASIRRIIEDSDTVRPPEDDAPVDFAAASDADQGEVEAFRAELDGPVSEQQAPETTDMEPSASIGAHAPAPTEPVDALIYDSGQTPSFDAAPVNAVAANDAARAAASEDKDDDHHVVHVRQRTGDHSSQVATSGQETAEVHLSRPSIISEQAGRQVAAAFGELSEAFAASRRRSFDEMAAEMLRPMLQDWLDNNLPTLVEKLVREEIERIARGTQA